MATMKRKTVEVPGLGATALLFGPGRVVIADLAGAARVEFQGYTEAELEAAFAEGRRPVPLIEHAADLAGQSYLDFKAASPDFVAAVIGAAWEVGTSVKDVGDTPLPGQDDARTNYFDGATDVEGL